MIRESAVEKLSVEGKQLSTETVFRAGDASHLADVRENQRTQVLTSQGDLDWFKPLNVTVSRKERI